ncbi:MAG: hypothetical protein EAX89_10145 [Candidatus Lokiarchaeota archaeon]|nr:hypothetical protein [Candidatus Lokiarchaeota archaeon]
MNLVTTIILVFFLGMEILNVITLYFKPGSKKSNAVGVFKAWEKSKNDSEIHDFVKYLVFWVAGTKIIFILLIIVIIIFGDPITQSISIIALIISIATFYWKLFPLIRKMDKENQIEPKGYSIGLGIMITTMIIALFIAFLIHFLQN